MMEDRLKAFEEMMDSIRIEIKDLLEGFEGDLKEKKEEIGEIFYNHFVRLSERLNIPDEKMREALSEMVKESRKAGNGSN